MPEKNFSLSSVEYDSYRAWYDTHYETCICINYALCEEQNVSSPAIGGALTYQFTPTSIGTAVVVSCACGAKHNCTDYDSW